MPLWLSGTIEFAIGELDTKITAQFIIYKHIALYKKLSKFCQIPKLKLSPNIALLNLQCVLTCITICMAMH